MEVPVHEYAWESHHSQLNRVSGVIFPAPALCEELELVNHCQTYDLYDADGKRATLYRVYKPEGAVFTSRLLYMRKDLLERYLGRTNQQIVWLPWGERILEHEEFEAKREEIAETWRQYHHIHKSFVGPFG